MSSNKNQVNRDELNHLILLTQSQNVIDVANVVYAIYKNIYKCVSIENNIWYEFRDNNWQKMYDNKVLYKKIGNDLVNEYLRLITSYNNTAYEQQDEYKDEYLEKSRKLTDVTYKLRTNAYKDAIIKECRILFYNSNFVPINN